MLCESKTGYLLNFIIYTGATTEYPDQPDPLPTKFDEYKSPSKVVLSLLHDYLHKGYCVTLDNVNVPFERNRIYQINTGNGNRK